MDEKLAGLEKVILIQFGDKELDQECAHWILERSVDPGYHQKVQDQISLYDDVPLPVEGTPTDEFALHAYESALIAETVTRVNTRYANGTMPVPEIHIYRTSVPGASAVNIASAEGKVVFGKGITGGKIHIGYENAMDFKDGGCTALVEVTAEEALHLALAHTGEVLAVQTPEEKAAAMQEIANRTSESVGFSVVASVDAASIGNDMYHADDSPLLMERIGGRIKQVTDEMQFAVDFLHS